MNDVGVTPLTSQQTAKAEADALDQSYPHEVAVAFDQFLDKVLNPHGAPDETMSSDIGEHALHHHIWAVVLAKMLDRLEPDHSALAAAADAARAKAELKAENESGLITP